MPAVPPDRIGFCLKLLHGIFDSDGKVKSKTDSVWLVAASLVDGLMSPSYLWQCVHENRYKLLDTLKDFFLVSSPSKLNLSESGTSSSEEQSLSSSSEDDVLLPKKIFKVWIPWEEWEKLRPIETFHTRSDRATKKRRVLQLPKNAWCDALIRLLWEQHNIPCPYTFKTSRVAIDPTLARQYIYIEAYCTECKATATGTVLTEPDEGQICVLEWTAEDTRRRSHAKKRQLRGPSRIAVGRELLGTTAEMYRRQKASEIMTVGGLEPPHLPKKNTLRVLRHEAKEEKLKLPKKKSVMEKLQEMKHTLPYVGSIHQIDLDKASVEYCTPSQMLIYKSHRKAHYTVLQVDATGSLVNKIRREHGSSGHIFLYEVVMQTSSGQLPICQMLSERHDTNKILYWLNDFQRRGAPVPHEVVCDGSAALISALVISFGKCSSTKEYTNRCFQFVTENNCQLPACYVRLDVCHMTHNVTKWKVWDDSGFKKVKDFYVRCFALLVHATSLVRFELLLYHILVLALSPKLGKHGKSQLRSEESLKFLGECIGDEKAFDKNYILENLNSSQDFQFREEISLECDSDEDEDLPASGLSLKLWVKKIIDNASNMKSSDGDRISPYHGDEIAHAFIQLSQSFLMRLAVLVGPFKSPNLRANSAGVEGDFGDLKTKVLKQEVRPVSAHKMVAIHLQSIDGQTKIVASKLISEKKPSKRKISEVDSNSSFELNNSSSSVDLSDNEFLAIHIPEKKKKPNDTKPPLPSEVTEVKSMTKSKNPSIKELRKTENWRGLGKKKKSKFFNSNPEAALAQETQKLKAPSKRLLRHGSKTGYVSVNKILTSIQNSCTFDTLCQSFGNAFIEFKGIRETMLQSQLLLFNTAVQLATHGATSQTYVLRASAIAELFEPESITPLYKATRNASAVAHTYNCWGDLNEYANKLLKNLSCATVTLVCERTSCKRNLTTNYCVVHADYKLLREKGLIALGESINSSLCRNNSCLGRCKGPTNVQEMTLASFLLVDIAVVKEKSTELLEDVPDNIERPITLCHFPASVIIGPEEKKYHLSSVMSYRPGHFLTFSRRVGGAWEMFDGLLEHPVNAASNSVVNAEVLLYVAE